MISLFRSGGKLGQNTEFRMRRRRKNECNSFFQLKKKSEVPISCNLSFTLRAVPFFLSDYYSLNMSAYLNAAYSFLRSKNRASCFVPNNALVTNRVSVLTGVIVLKAMCRDYLCVTTSRFLSIFPDEELPILVLRSLNSLKISYLIIFTTIIRPRTSTLQFESRRRLLTSCTMWSREFTGTTEANDETRKLKSCLCDVP